jgi:hypothetical protein
LGSKGLYIAAIQKGSTRAANPTGKRRRRHVGAVANVELIKIQMTNSEKHAIIASGSFM